MPYEYRSLSPEERQRIVQERRERGFPWHAPPHPFRDAGYYLLTATNYEHAHIMALPERRTELEMRLLSGLQAVGVEIIAWVILPNHYHALVGIESLEDVSGVLKFVHGTTSREWNVADGVTNKRRVWYHYTDRMIRGESHFFRGLNYVHFNAVKHGYVDDPYDWPWQSLECYLEVYGRDWLRERWRLYPPDEMGKGWDD